MSAPRPPGRARLPAALDTSHSARPPVCAARAVREARLAQIRRGCFDAGDDFWYSVVTTGVYCRPGCPTRRAKPENIRFHDTLAEAQATGFRACRRCDHAASTPQQRNQDRIAAACRLIAGGTDGPMADRMADTLGISKAHFYKVFRQVTGTTPTAWARSARSITASSFAGDVSPSPASRSTSGSTFPPTSGRCRPVSSRPPVDDAGPGGRVPGRGPHCRPRSLGLQSRREGDENRGVPHG